VLLYSRVLIRLYFCIFLQHLWMFTILFRCSTCDGGTYLKYILCNRF